MGQYFSCFVLVDYGMNNFEGCFLIHFFNTFYRNIDFFIRIDRPHSLCGRGTENKRNKITNRVNRTILFALSRVA